MLSSHQSDPPSAPPSSLLPLLPFMNINMHEVQSNFLALGIGRALACSYHSVGRRYIGMARAAPPTQYTLKAFKLTY